MENENINDIKKILADAFNCTSDIANVSTITGEPIVTANGTTIIPVSKVAVGMATGGLDFNSKKPEDNSGDNSKKKRSPKFGGGGGTGVSVTPVGFLVINPDGKVEMLNINNEAGLMVDSIANFIERSPEIINKIKASFSKD